MRGYSLKFCYLVFVFFLLVIMILKLCVYNASVFTSCYGPWKVNVS
jgi:hypothetical protein